MAEYEEDKDFILTYLSISLRQLILTRAVYNILDLGQSNLFSVILFILDLDFLLFCFNVKGIQAELVLGTIARKESNNEVCNGDYLEDRVSFSEDKVMDAESKAVMMAWEKPLMEAHAKAVCMGGSHILNVGFGMGIVDTAIQQYSPTMHTIIEAHPDVYKRMIETGWGDKNNVKIIFGRWQDVLPQLESYDGELLIAISLSVIVVIFHVSLPYLN